MQWWQILSTCGVFSIFSGLVTSLIKYLAKKKADKRNKDKQDSEDRDDRIDKSLIFWENHAQELNNAVTDMKKLMDSETSNKELIIELKESVNKLSSDIQQIRGGLQASLRNGLIDQYNKSVDEGSVTLAQKDNFQNMYKYYQKLGQNGVMEDIHKKYMALPVNVS